MDSQYIYCHHCRKQIGRKTFATFMSVYKERAPEGKVRCYCSAECWADYKKMFECEIYKDRPIYKIVVDDEIKYIPYWGCHYGFAEIEDCRARMDSSYVGLYAGNN